MLLKDIAPIQLMMGADSFYWTEMTHDENQNPQPFSKFVRLGKLFLLIFWFNKSYFHLNIIFLPDSNRS